MMTISSEEELKEYGYFLSLDTHEIISYLENKSKFPKENNIYVRDDKDFHLVSGIEEIKEKVFGNADIEVGYCNGFNTKLNCLEYHVCPEVDIAGDDLILLLALQKDIDKNGLLDSKKVKAFKIKKGQAFVLYPYALHFSPCRLTDRGFKCAIVLTDKTNMDLESKPIDNKLFKVNKWLLAHKEAKQVSLGAYVGITGDNIDILC